MTEMKHRRLADILATLSVDLAGLRQIAGALDDGLASAAPGGAVPHLQQVDFLAQYLGDLADVMAKLGRMVDPAQAIDASELVRTIRLDDLRRHLLGLDCATSAGTRDGGDVNLF